ncbi:DUF2000 domain-containing protein [Kribbella sp. NPDC056861]|uniref:DUF2000 domain-containing protein n=1 Tax=Kribbella sp. NPDC056861 TaxID=3154857 RepID=UPI003413882D
MVRNVQDVRGCRRHAVPADVPAAGAGLRRSKEFLPVAHQRALGRGLTLAVFTQDLFATGNDRDNRAAVKAVRQSQLDLVGLALHGPKNAVDKILKGSRMHP